MTPRPLLTVFAFILCFSIAACEDRRADKAYLRGDYDKALTDIKFLANGGEARAQYDLGLMYDQGQGVPQSDTEAMYWYGRAADQGEPRALYNLGLMYLNGQGVPPDLVKAYYLISLSASKGNAHALDARDYISEKMSTEQIEEGKRLIQDYEEKAAQKNACVVCNLVSGKPPQ
ncbi:MAG TPA: tetratricopeptide repeat protein [Nitrospira sp.]